MFRFIFYVILCQMFSNIIIGKLLKNRITIDKVDKKQSLKVHRLLKLIKKELHSGNKLKNDINRNLMMSPPSYDTEMKIGKAFGGALSVKLPDNPSPIFLNQSPFYAF